MRLLSLLVRVFLAILGDGDFDLAFCQTRRGRGAGAAAATAHCGRRVPSGKHRASRRILTAKLCAYQPTRCPSWRWWPSPSDRSIDLSSAMAQRAGQILRAVRRRRPGDHRRQLTTRGRRPATSSSPRGEFRATRRHRTMYPERAHPGLLCEQIGQVCFHDVAEDVAHRAEDVVMGLLHTVFLDLPEGARAIAPRMCSIVEEVSSPPGMCSSAGANEALHGSGRSRCRSRENGSSRCRVADYRVTRSRRRCSLR